MKYFQFLSGSFFIGNFKWVTGIKQRQVLSQKLKNAFYSIGTPRFTLFDWTQKHFIHSQRICSIFCYQVIRIYDIEFGLRHLLHLPSTDVLSAFQDKYCICHIRPGLFECLNIEYIIFHHTHVNMDWDSVILLSQPFGNVLVFTFYTVNKVWSSLYHSLVHQLPGVLLYFDITPVK